MNERDRKQIIRAAELELERWSDPTFGNRLDAASLPIDFGNTKEQTFAEEAEGWHVDMSGFGGKNPLKQWLRAIDQGKISDAEAEFLAGETNDPRLVLDHIDRKAAVVSNAFVKAHPEYLVNDSNFKLMIAELAELAGLPGMSETKEERNALIAQLYNMGFYTLENLTHAFHNLQAAGELEFPAGMFRPLSEQQKHMVRAKLALGSVPEAITHYLAYAKGTHPDVMAFTNPQAFLNDPTNLPLIRECLAFIFSELHPEFEPTPERINWLLNWTGQRFPTLALLNSGWNRLQQLEREETARAERHALVYGDAEEKREETPIAEGLENLSDSEIDNLLRRTRADLVKRSRRGPGIIL